MSSPRPRAAAQKLEVTQIRRGRKGKVRDLVIREIPLTVFLNDVNLATFMCSPGDLEQLAVGFLFTEGVLPGLENLKSVFADDREGAVWVVTKGTRIRRRDLLSRRVITTGCGRGLSFHDPDSLKDLPRVRTNASVRAEELTSLMMEIQRRSELFRSTGGVHSAAVCDRSGVLVLKEDIGRHNAIDKAVGECVLMHIDMRDKLLVTSGRVSSDMVIKAARAGIPFILSKSAPTALGVRLAKGFGLTLVGFVRGSRMNVYSHAQRVT